MRPSMRPSMNTVAMITMSCIAALGACAHQPADTANVEETADSGVDAAGAAGVVVARGNEPGWIVTVGADQTDFVLDYGDKRFSSPTPAPELNDAGAVYRYADAGATLAIADAYCADDMSGMPHPKTATLEEGGRTMNGCAGEPMDLLTGDEWVVEDIGGAGVIDIARTSMQFGEDGRVTGSGACNRYGASYTLTGEGLSIGPVMATKRGCVEAVMDQEDRFFTALDAVDRFEIDATGALVLFGGGEQLLLARR